MEPCNILYRILDLISTWREDSPYTRSLNLVMQDPMMRIIQSCRKNQEILSNNMSANSSSHRKYEKSNNNVCHGSALFSSDSLEKQVFVKKSSHINNLKRSTDSLIDNLMNNTLPPK